MPLAYSLEGPVSILEVLGYGSVCLIIALFMFLVVMTLIKWVAWIFY